MNKNNTLFKALLIPALVVIGLSSNAGAAAIKIEVDPRVELVGIVFRLAGNYEFNQGRIRSYVRDIERQFGDFDDHPAVKLAARLFTPERLSRFKTHT